MLKKIILSFCMITSIVGCSDVTENTKNNFNESSVSLSKDSYSMDQNKNSYKSSKDIYVCDNDEFFYVEKQNHNRALNFIYGSYSISLLKKPSIGSSDLYSDGLYNLKLQKENALVSFNNNQILTNCKLKV